MKRRKLPEVVGRSAVFIGLFLGVLSVLSLGLGPGLEGMKNFGSLTALKLFFSPTRSMRTHPESIGESEDCFLNSDDRPMVGWSNIRARLGMPVRLAGYGIWPFWGAPFSAPFLGKDAADEIVGDLLVMYSESSAWVLVTLDSIGVPSPIVATLSAGIRSKVQEELKPLSARGNRSLECVVVSIVASHSHSSPDLTGIWGGPADSWRPARNQHNARASIHEPLLASLREAAGHSISEALPARLTVDHDFFSTAATATVLGAKDRPPQSLSSGANLTRIWIERDGHERSVGAGASPAAKKAVVWIWNGHAATDPRSVRSEFGDFPAEVRQALGADLHSFFLPGVIAGDYPIEHSGWRGELIGRVRQPPKARSGSFSIGLRQRDYCLESENRLRAVLAQWAMFGGGAGLAECPEPQPDSGDSSFISRFQSIRIHLGDSKESDALELALVPFETFSEVELQLRHAMDTNLRIVSLANGFDGHGLARQQFDSLMSGAQESNRAKPYHLFLAIRGSIEEEIMNFFKESQR